MNGPSTLLLAHLAILGRWCPGYGQHPHPADNLTARTGRVLCRDCSDHLEAMSGAPS